jgi:hypothetical protein
VAWTDSQEGRKGDAAGRVGWAKVGGEVKGWTTRSGRCNLLALRLGNPALGRTARGRRNDTAAAPTFRGKEEVLTTIQTFSMLQP